MDQAYVEQNDVIERYARNALNESELEQFEIYLLDHPELLSKIAFAEEMHVAAKDADLEKSVVSSNEATFNWRSAALAASAAFVVSTVGLIYTYQTNPVDDQDSPNVVSAIQSHTFILSERSGSSTTVIEAKEGLIPGLVSIEVPASLAGKSIDVTIIDLDSNEIRVLDDAYVNDQNLVTIFLRQISEGKYRIEVSAADDSVKAIPAMIEIK